MAARMLKLDSWPTAVPAAAAMPIVRRVKAAAAFLPAVLSCYAIVLYASLGRPIWIDEFLHFSLGALSTADIWPTIRHSITGVNHGQTGIYMLTNYLSLWAFGANIIVLRLPSILSGMLLFFAVLQLFRTLGLSVVWQIIAIIAMFGQSTTLFYIGEARPYMPLVGATAALFAYYMVPFEQRRTAAGLLFGYGAMLLGVSMHPYFAVYWPLLCLVAYAYHCWTGQSEWGIKPLLAHANIPMCAIGAAIFVALACSTWLFGGPTFSTDPFMWIGPANGPNPWRNFSDVSHFEFISGRVGRVALATALVVSVLAAVPSRLRGSLRPLWTPLLLLTVVLALSLFLGYVSYRRSYWILPRQWVASAAFVVIAVVWLWAEIARISARLIPASGPVVGLFALYAVMSHALPVHATKLKELRTYLATPRIVVGQCPPPDLGPPQTTDSQKGNDMWVELARHNIACGGKVWRVFGYYYGKDYSK
jgi:hypothetical protein